MQRALQDIDRVGAELSKSDWIDLCDEVAAYYDASAETARDELRNK